MKEDFDKTRVMSPEEQQAMQGAEPEQVPYSKLVRRTGAAPGQGGTQPTGNGMNMSNTQPLPRVGDDYIQQPFPQVQPSTVRELPPEPPERPEPPKKGGLTTGQKRGLILAAFFIIALFVGFAIAGYSEEKDMAAKEAKLAQKQEMLQQEQDIKAREQELKERKIKLEQQKKELEAREHELKEAQKVAKAKNETLEDEKSDNVLGKALDKVTGKEAERAKKQADNAAASAKADDDIAKVKQSIADAQTMLDEVDQGLDKVQSMKNDVAQVKGRLEATYAENKGTIDTVVSYVRTGIDLVRGLMNSN